MRGSIVSKGVEVTGLTASLQTAVQRNGDSL